MTIPDKIKKEYDKPRTPYQRLLSNPHVSQETKDALTKVYLQNDPIQISVAVNQFTETRSRKRPAINATAMNETPKMSHIFNDEPWGKTDIPRLMI